MTSLFTLYLPSFLYSRNMIKVLDKALHYLLLQWRWSDVVKDRVCVVAPRCECGLPYEYEAARV